MKVSRVMKVIIKVTVKLPALDVPLHMK